MATVRAKIITAVRARRRSVDGQIGTPSCYFLVITSENHITQFNVSATKELGFISQGVYAVFLNCDKSSNGDKQFVNIRDHTQVTIYYFF